MVYNVLKHLPSTTNLFKSLPQGKSLCLALTIFVVGCGNSADSGNTFSTAYYVNNSSDSRCSNINIGTSSDMPWCDFTNINQRTFQAGDNILLARGATWNQQLNLNGSGSLDQPITLGTYGTGVRPKIIRNGDATEQAVHLNNPSYWNISDLEVGNAGVGILVYFSSLSHEGLSFKNIYAHDIRGIHHGNISSNGNSNCTTTDRIFNSAGLLFTSTQSLTISKSQFIVQNIVVSGFEGTRNQDSISFDYCNGLITTDGNGLETYAYNATRHVLLKDLYLHNNNGPAEGCDESLRLVDLQDATVMNTYLEQEAGCNSASGTTGIIIGGVKNLNIVNSIIAHTSNTNSPDQAGIDFECCTNQVRIRNSLFIGNAGAGIEFLGIYSYPNVQLNNEVTSSFFINNATANQFGFYGGILRLGNKIMLTGIIRDNIYSEITGFLRDGSEIDAGGDFSGFTQINNLAATNSDDIYYAGYGFSDSQGLNNWSYQYGNDFNWINLIFDTSSNAWGNLHSKTPQITRFGMYPDSSSSLWLSRRWTAPKAGTISIRGRVLKAEIGGNGIVARVTKNGTVIWGPKEIAFDDIDGIESNLDGLDILTGDMIRFEISSKNNNDSDMTSWSPGIAYTSQISRLQYANSNQSKNYELSFK
jgi:hypothetical protein